MKKMLLTSAFALIGTFAMANETNTTTVVEKECDLFKSSTVWRLYNGLQR
ncbi:hypothetical protein [Empedobacter sp.]|nr:hypothetical protein [Empedobacter sp.]